jgi:hypothetical protein
MPATAGKHDSNPFACLACGDDDIRYRLEGIRYRAEADDKDIFYRVEGSRYRTEADVVRLRAVTFAFRARRCRPLPRGSGCLPRGNGCRDDIRYRTGVGSLYRYLATSTRQLRRRVGQNENGCTLGRNF